MGDKEIGLIMLAQKGEEAAFNELYKLYYKQAYYLALKISNCDADAQDAAQETFIEIQKSIKNLREPKTFRKWMARIVVSKCNKIFRKNKYTVLDPDIVDAMPIEETREYMSGEIYAKAKQRREILLELMNGLTQQRREILVLMYFEQFSIKEIAEILDIPIGTVKSRLLNAKAALREKTEKLEKRDAIRMHTCPLPLLALLAFKKDFKRITHLKPRASMLSFTIIQPFIWSGVALSMVLVVGAGVHALNERYVDPDTLEYTLSKDEKTFTEKEVYFKLRDWAHCHVEMKKKSAEEYAEIMTYYTYLKDINGPYYQRLVFDNWSKHFEENKK